ncbi:MAG: CAP domain-containing protein [bacterium]|nr:CAP domain-containing protein [bacterium]
MKQLIIDTFIPHAGNDYHPHWCRQRRMRRYTAAFVVMKLVVVTAILATPASLFMSEQSLVALEDALINHTNAQRVSHGQLALYPDIQLERSAVARAIDLGTSGYFSHVGPNGQEFEDFLQRSGYHYAAAGENLAMGFTDAEAIVEAWMASPSHRANILAADYADIGIGATRGTFGGQPVVYIAQHVGSRATDVQAAASVRFVEQDRSSVDWSATDGGTAISIVVESALDVETLTAQVYSATIPLTKRGSTTFVGSAVLPQEPDALFTVQLLPTVTARVAGGFEYTETVDWKRVYVPRMSLRERFTQRKVALLESAPSFFLIARTLFGAALTVSVCLLIVGMVTETRKRHPKMLGRMATFAFVLALLFIL